MRRNSLGVVRRQIGKGYRASKNTVLSLHRLRVYRWDQRRLSARNWNFFKIREPFSSFDPSGLLIVTETEESQMMYLKTNVPAWERALRIVMGAMLPGLAYLF